MLRVETDLQLILEPIENVSIIVPEIVVGGGSVFDEALAQRSFGLSVGQLRLGVRDASDGVLLHQTTSQTPVEERARLLPRHNVADDAFLVHPLRRVVQIGKVRSHLFIFINFINLIQLIQLI